MRSHLRGDQHGPVAARATGMHASAVPLILNLLQIVRTILCCKAGCQSRRRGGPESLRGVVIPPISCNTVLPNGQTIRDVVHDALNRTVLALNSANTPVGVGFAGGTFTSVVWKGGELDFKNDFRGQAPGNFLGDAGNFAYGAYMSALAGPSVSNAGAILYNQFVVATGQKPGSLSAANGMDKSAAANVPRGNANAGCP